MVEISSREDVVCWHLQLTMGELGGICDKPASEINTDFISTEFSTTPSKLVPHLTNSF